MAKVQKLPIAKATMLVDLRANLFPRSAKGKPQKSPTAATGTTNTKSPRFSRVNSKKKQEERIKINRVLSTLDEQLQESTTEDDSAVQITNENQAKAKAKKIFCNVAKPGSK
ncbi:unnamed protein product [Ilex paraguariensis]|uniref:Uncharacterized protein n=1 Tax=Ilex paraguariensis TaxID=185542 RepID=A0ABC8SMB0_9AQUA